MKKKVLLVVTAVLGLQFLNIVAQAATVNFGDVTYTPSFSASHYSPVWNLMAGDLTLSYSINLSGVTQTAASETPYVEVGLREQGASDFNPGPFGTYQGGKGGWMTSLVMDLTPSPGNLSLMDKHNLSASGGRGESDYDVYTATPTTIESPPFGSFNTTGIWYDRDSVDPWQDTFAANTGGTYDIVITYRAVNAGLGTMVATINGNGTDIVEQKFLVGGSYEAGGLSFKGDMTKMQVFTGAWWTGGAGGSVIAENITASQVPEPATMLLLGLGLMGLVGAKRKFQN